MYESEFRALRGRPPNRFEASQLGDLAVLDVRSPTEDRVRLKARIYRSLFGGAPAPVVTAVVWKDDPVDA
jgi:hypothetical protein